MKPKITTMPKNSVIEEYTSKWKDKKDHIEILKHITYDDGTEVYLKNNVYHRMDGPAVIINKKKHYYISGKEFNKEDYNLRVEEIDYEIEHYQGLI